MNNPFLIIVSILAGIFLGTLSNWIYDLLKQKAVLPERPTVRLVLMVLLFFLPLAVLVALPQLLSPANSADAERQALASTAVALETQKAVIGTASGNASATQTAFEAALESVQATNQALLNREAETPVSGSLPADPSGKIVYTCQVFYDARNQICLMNADGSDQRRLTREDNASFFYPSWAPDGNAIVLSSNASGKYEIYEMDLNGNLNRLTFGLGDELTAPEISPDGRRIAFANFRDGFASVWVMNRDGSGAYEVYRSPGVDALDPTWSPDGSHLLFALGLGNERQLYITDLQGENLRPVSSSFTTRGHTDWSPDGSAIATYAGEPWLREIYRVDVESGDVRRLTSGGNNLAPHYSPDGQWLVFTSYRDHYGDDYGCEVYIMRVDGTGLRRLTDNAYCDWQPDWGT